MSPHAEHTNLHPGSRSCIPNRAASASILHLQQALHQSGVCSHSTVISTRFIRSSASIRHLTRLTMPIWATRHPSAHTYRLQNAGSGHIPSGLSFEHPQHCHARGMSEKFYSHGQCQRCASVSMPCRVLAELFAFRVKHNIKRTVKLVRTYEQQVART